MAETDQWTAELQREREARVLAEARLERLEQRLREFERSQQAAAAQDVESIRVQQILLGGPPAPKAEPTGPALHTWLVEARMAAVDPAEESAPVYTRPKAVPILTAAAYDSAATHARVETAVEADRLRRELEEVRANERRALDRLRELEQRVADAEAEALRLQEAATEQKPETPWTDQVLDQVQSAVETDAATTESAVEESAYEEVVARPIADVLSVPDLERRVQPSSGTEMDFPADIDAETSAESSYRDVETEVALRSFARAILERPEVQAIFDAPDPSDTPVPEAAVTDPEPEPAEAAAAEPEPVPAEAVPEEAAFEPDPVPPAEETPVEVPEYSAFSQIVQAWGAREAERVAPAEETPLEEAEEPAPAATVGEAAPELETPGGPRPEDRSEAMTEALQRFFGKKPE